MNSTNWKDIAELVGITAIVVSLVFVGLQMRQAQEIAKTEVGMSVLASEVQIRNEMNERADIWNRGSAGEDLSVDDRLIFNHLVNNLYSHSFWEYRQWLRLDSDNPNNPIYNLAMLLHQNPGALAEYLEIQEKNKKYYSIREVPLEAESFQEKLLEILEKQDQL